VVVQGVGKVGVHLCHLLHEAGARLTVADVDVDNVARAVKEFGADTVEPAKAHAVACDIFAPCAMGAVVNDDTLPELKCAAIAGSANNVLGPRRARLRPAPDRASCTPPTTWSTPAA
jgi:leucine dehydrogenase